MENKTPKIESMVDLTKDFVSEESANSYIAKQKTNFNSPLFGLALSLGSSCLIIAGQEQQATAAVYFPLQTQASLSQTKQPVANNKIIKHRVGKGDTLKKIAKKYKLPVDKIANYNKISKQGNLAVGKTILIPQQVKVAKKSNKISQTQTKNNLPDKSKFEIASLNLPHQDKQKARHIPRFISSSQAEKISLEINNPTIQKQSITRQKKINSKTQSPAKEFVFTASDKSSPESNALTYKVKSGDTLDKIAQRYHLNLQDLLAANQITNPNLIRVDSLLNIPLQTKEKTQEKSNTALDIKSQSLKNNHIQQLKQDIAKLKQEYSDSSQITQSLTDKTPNSSASNLTDNLNNSQETIVGTVPNSLSNYNSVLSNSIGDKVGPDLPALLSPEQYLPNAPKKFNGYIWPAKGVLTSGYGMRWGRMHKGIDIAGPVGTPIVAAAPGEVVYASWNSGGYGNLVKLKHPNGSITLYAHNSKIFVRKGQFVGQGQQIAAMGSTGFSTGPHLHFEIHPLGSTAVNPMRFLAKKSN